MDRRTLTRDCLYQYGLVTLQEGGSTLTYNYIDTVTRPPTLRNEMVGCMTFKLAEILGPDKVRS